MSLFKAIICTATAIALPFAVTLYDILDWHYNGDEIVQEMDERKPLARTGKPLINQKLDCSLTGLVSLMVHLHVHKHLSSVVYWFVHTINTYQTLPREMGNRFS